MIDNNAKYRVYNTCKYDIGVTFINGLQANIKPGSFALMTVDDVAYIESAFPSHFFSRGLLVAKTSDGEPLNLLDAGLQPVEDVEKHFTDDEIRDALRMSAKKLEAWLGQIDDPSELHMVYEIAKQMDLPASKLNLLAAKMPEKDWLDAE